MTVGARKQFCLHISNKADGDTTQRDREYRRKIFLIERDEFCEYATFEDFPGGPVAMPPNTRSLGSIPHQGNTSHMPSLKILHATTKDSTCHN